MSTFTNKLKAAFWIAVDIFSGFFLGLVIGAGLLCLIPLAIVFGVLFVIWIIAEFIVAALRGDFDKDKPAPIDYADEDD